MKDSQGMFAVSMLPTKHQTVIQRALESRSVRLYNCGFSFFNYNEVLITLVGRTVVRVSFSIVLLRTINVQYATFSLRLLLDDVVFVTSPMVTMAQPFD